MLLSFEQRMKEISYHYESPSTVLIFFFPITASLWPGHNTGGAFIIPILKDKLNTPIVMLNLSCFRFQVRDTC